MVGQGNHASKSALALGIIYWFWNDGGDNSEAEQYSSPFFCLLWCLFLFNWQGKSSCSAGMLWCWLLLFFSANLSSYATKFQRVLVGQHYSGHSALQLVWLVMEKHSFALFKLVSMWLRHSCVGLYYFNPMAPVRPSSIVKEEYQQQFATKKYYVKKNLVQGYLENYLKYKIIR